MDLKWYVWTVWPSSKIMHPCSGDVRFASLAGRRLSVVPFSPLKKSPGSHHLSPQALHSKPCKFITHVAILRYGVYRLPASQLRPSQKHASLGSSHRIAIIQEAMHNERCWIVPFKTDRALWTFSLIILKSTIFPALNRSLQRWNWMQTIQRNVSQLQGWLISNRYVSSARRREFEET